MDLHHDFSDRHGVVVHIGIEIRETAGREIAHFGFIKAVAHSDFERPGENCAFRKLLCSGGKSRQFAAFMPRLIHLAPTSRERKSPHVVRN